MYFLLILAKIFVFPIGFIIAIGLINMLIVLIARPFINIPKFPLIYNILCTMFYILIYTLWGAYMRAVVLNYSSYLNKWVLIFLCIASIFTFIKYIDKEAQSERAKMNEMNLLDSNSHKEIFSQSITVVCLGLSPVILVSFIIFFFTEGLYENFYFKYADMMAKSFM